MDTWRKYVEAHLRPMKSGRVFTYEQIIPQILKRRRMVSYDWEKNPIGNVCHDLKNGGIIKERRALVFNKKTKKKEMKIIQGSFRILGIFPANKDVTYPDKRVYPKEKRFWEAREANWDFQYPGVPFTEPEPVYKQEIPKEILREVLEEMYEVIGDMAILTNNVKRMLGK